MIHERFREWERPDYERISVVEPWSERLHKKYLSRKANAVAIECGDDCAYLPTLPGLKQVIVWNRMRDDSDVFRCSGLESLLLYDRCKRALEVDRLPVLKELEVDDRAGLETVAGHPALVSLSVSSLRRSDAGWLGPSTSIRYLGLSAARRRPFDLSGLAHAPTLSAVMLEGLELSTFDVFRSMRHLRALSVSRASGVRGGALDLRVLAELPQFEYLYLDQVSVAGLDSLRAKSGLELRVVRLTS